MQRLQKIAYVVGISIAVSVFVLFLYSFLPHLIQNDQWERVDGLKLTDEELLKEFKIHPAYVAFYERFPDAKEELRNERHGGQLEVGVANFEDNNYLTLHLYFNNHDDDINANVNCDSSNDTQNRHANGLFVIEFIKQTNCLDLEPMESEHTTKSTKGIITLD